MNNSDPTYAELITKIADLQQQNEFIRSEAKLQNEENIRLIAQLTNAKEAAEESEKKYRLIAENTSDGILVVGSDTKIEYVSPAYMEQIGYPLELELSRDSESIYSIIHPEDRDEVFKKIFSAIDDKLDNLTYTYRVKHSEGYYVYREDNARFNYDNNKNLINTYAICRDITNRVKVEQDLEIANATIALQEELLISKQKIEESEKKARLLLDNLPCVAMIINKSDHTVVASNSKALDFGIENAMPCFKSWSDSNNSCDFCLADLAHKTNAPLEKELFRNGKFYNFLWVPLNEHQFIHYIFDITERKNNEQALRENEERLSLINKCSNDAILDWDISKNNLFYSDHWWEQVGYAPNEIKADVMHWKELIHIDNYDEVRQLYYSVINGKTESFELEYQIKHKNGHYVPTLVRGIVLHDAKGNPTRVTATSMDLSHIKQQELIIKKQNDELIKLNADKNLFFQILAHDLRSPFNSILIFLDILKKNFKKNHPIEKHTVEELNEITKYGNQIDLIHKSAHNFYDLLENLLCWTRAHLGKINFEATTINLSETCQRAVENFKLTANQKKISIIISSSTDIDVCADTNMLDTILRNLLSNALKFSNEGGCVNISAEKKENQVLISISDNGIGMSESTKGKLFDIATMQKTTGTANESGTGLGLLICKEFVEKHGGKIWVESELGIGSDFKFTIGC